MFDNFDLNNIIAGDGILISIVGYLIVFASLLVLSIFISRLKNILTLHQRKKLKASGHRAADYEDLDVSEEINAAIGMALYLHFAEAHDFENTVLTIKRVQKPYSPWSSKLYGLRQYPKNN
ncbi:MAG: OadG family protein [Melioribacteraceae bacterium]|nr:OadG family protein [Melioribacteraceae bacterium]MCO6474441.1 OadG family protein [Melioribacteraceae bacterium]MDD3558034.1 OadG family protein [Melioribacteraceae bacterium]